MGNFSCRPFSGHRNVIGLRVNTVNQLPILSHSTFLCFTIQPLIPFFFFFLYSITSFSRAHIPPSTLTKYHPLTKRLHDTRTQTERGREREREKKIKLNIMTDKCWQYSWYLRSTSTSHIRQNTHISNGFPCMGKHPIRITSTQRMVHTHRIQTSR